MIGFLFLRDRSGVVVKDCFRWRARQTLAWSGIAVCAISFGPALCGRPGLLADPDSSVSLLWFPSPSPEVIGYAVYYGAASGAYDFRVDAGTNRTVTVTNLAAGQTYFFAVTAYDVQGDESSPSNEVSFFVASSQSNNAPNLQIMVPSAGTLTMNWGAVSGRTYQAQYKTDLNQVNWSNLGNGITVTNDTGSVSDAIGPDPERFYRVIMLP